MSGRRIWKAQLSRPMFLEFRKVRWVLRIAPGLVGLILPPSVAMGTPMRLAKLIVMLPYVVWS